MDIKNEKIHRILQWANGISQPPTTIELNPTNRCNLLCRSCWQREFDLNYDEMSKERLIELMKEAAELGVREVRIPGSGEPFVKEGMLDILSEIKKNGMEGQVITNGTILTETIVDTLVDIGWDCVTVSIDGPDARTNDFLRGKTGAFKSVRKNLLYLKKKIESTGSGKPYLRSNTVISNKNFDRLHEIILFGHELGIKDCQFQPMTVWGDEGKELDLDDEMKKKLQKLIPLVQKKADSFNIATNISCFLDNDIVENASGSMTEIFNKEEKKETEADSNFKDHPFLHLPCFEPWYNMIILPDGSAAACSIQGTANTDNIENKSLSDAWYGSDFETIRKRLLIKNLPGYCSKCCAVVHVENQRIKERLKEML